MLENCWTYTLQYHIITLLLLNWVSACNTSNSTPSTTSTLISLQESKKLADDLQIAASLQAVYQEFYNNTQRSVGNTAHTSFVGIQGMKNALRNMPGHSHGNLTKFKSWAETGAWEQFGPTYHHYDWWMFPIDRESHGQGSKYAVHQQDIKELKGDKTWLKDYRLGVILLMRAWGWDVKNHQCYTNPASGQKWNGHDTRLGKMANSLILFEQWDLYASLKAYVKHLGSKGIRLEDWVLEYFP